MQEAFVAEIEDLSHLSEVQFWARMRENGKVWSFDEQVWISIQILMAYPAEGNSICVIACE